jgi:hypothetical protein
MLLSFWNFKALLPRSYTFNFVLMKGVPKGTPFALKRSGTLESWVTLCF